MNDVHGREYAKLSQLKVGDKVQVDGSFTCLRNNEVQEVHMDKDGDLYILCAGVFLGEGMPGDAKEFDRRDEFHFLYGQLADDGDGDSLIGIYKL